MDTMKRFFSAFFLACFLMSTVLIDTAFSQGEGVVLDFEPAAGSEGVVLDFEPDTSAYPLKEFSSSVEPVTPTFLWKLVSEKNTIYILGSIHLAKEELYPLDERIEEAFNECDVLVVEVNLNNIDPAALQAKFAERGVYSAGETLKGHVSVKTFNLTREKLENLGMDINQMAIFKPWFLALNLMTSELVKSGFNPNFGIDQYFLWQAKENKEILEFESIDYQLELFDSFSDKEQELFLLSTLVDLDILEEEVNEMLKAWETGDIDFVESILRRGLRNNPDFLPVYEKLFYERNRKMASKIESFLKRDDDYFIIVGAGHLVGREGIIALLEKEGYYSEQL